MSVGARDLAFMMALHWYPERRRALERPLLSASRPGASTGMVRDGNGCLMTSRVGSDGVASAE
jgi:hypothetical protein